MLRNAVLALILLVGPSLPHSDFPPLTDPSAALGGTTPAAAAEPAAVLRGSALAPGHGPGPGQPATIQRLSGHGRIETAVAVSAATFARSETALLARADDYADALSGAPVAVHLDGPVLLTGNDDLPAVVTAELDRLGATTVVLLGGEGAIGAAVAAALTAQGREVRRISGGDRFGTAAALAAELPPSDAVYITTAGAFADALAVAPLAGATGRPILLVTPSAVPPETRAALAERDPAQVTVIGGLGAVSAEVATALGRGGALVDRIAGPSRLETAALVYDAALADGMSSSAAWIASAADFPDAIVAGAAAGARREPLLLVPPGDVFDARAAAHRLWFRREGLQAITILGGPAAVHRGAEAQVAELLYPGPQLPGGGRTIFPRYTVVGDYGSTASPAMGVLGEGTPAQAAQRVIGRAAAFDRPERQALPLFELIVTIATRSPGPDGDYSAPTTVESARTYLEEARKIGALMVLDIQPGRSHFLNDVRRFEALLIEPDVGIALDPEWRMGPNERPGHTIGSVSAEEINEVSAYVADLVARHDLPEKLFVLHQFRTSMIRDRDKVVDRPGLAVLFHIDGFGDREAKLQTYGVLADPKRLLGFKLFLDEDTNIFKPAEALAIEPHAALFTYQ